jgi:hypothetical protein
MEVEHAELGGTLDFRIGDAAASAQLDATIGRAWIQYELGRKRWGCEGPVASWGAGIGARVYAIDASARVQSGLGGTSIDRSKVWIDPTIGFEGSLQWRNGTSLRVAADMGGFGVGSDLSWFALAELSMPLGRRWDLTLGWAWHVIDFTRGVGDERLSFELLLSGPRLALTYTF